MDEIKFDQSIDNQNFVDAAARGSELWNAPKSTAYCKRASCNSIIVEKASCNSIIVLC